MKIIEWFTKSCVIQYRCGLLRQNMMNLGHQLSTGNASDLFEAKRWKGNLYYTNTWQSFPLSSGFAYFYLSFLFFSFCSPFFVLMVISLCFFLFFFLLCFAAGTLNMKATQYHSRFDFFFLLFTVAFSCRDQITDLDFFLYI